MEQPWVSCEDVAGPDGEELVWDFCAEEPGWLEQLVELYSTGRVRTRNISKNMVPVQEFTDEELAKFTDAMLKDKWFVSKFRKDYQDASPGLRLKLKAVLPVDFLERGLA